MLNIKAKFKNPLTLRTGNSENPAAGNEAITAATEYVETVRAYNEARAALIEKREALLEVVAGQREKKLRNGVNDPSIKIPTLQGETVQVVYQDRYRTIDSSNIPALKHAFGQDYDVLVEEVESISLQPGVTSQVISNKIGVRAFNHLKGLLKISTGVRPRRGAFEKLAVLFATPATQQQAEDMVTFLEATASQPQVRNPG